MFKTTSDLTHYLARQGSHSTKEHRTGRIDAIPAWAQEAEDYYNSLKERWASLQEQRLKCQNDLAAINEKLKATLPRKEFEHLSGMRTALGAKYKFLQDEAINYRALARAASEKSWATTFYHVAQKILDTKIFVQLDEETQNLLRRGIGEIPKGRAEMSPEKLESLRIQGRRQERRKRMRARLKKFGDGSAMVTYTDDFRVAHADEQKLKNQIEPAEQLATALARLKEKFG